MVDKAAPRKSSTGILQAPADRLPQAKPPANASGIAANRLGHLPAQALPPQAPRLLGAMPRHLAALTKMLVDGGLCKNTNQRNQAFELLLRNASKCRSPHELRLSVVGLGITLGGAAMPGDALDDFFRCAHAALEDGVLSADSLGTAVTGWVQSLGAAAISGQQAQAFLRSLANCQPWPRGALDACLDPLADMLARRPDAKRDRALAETLKECGYAKKHIGRFGQKCGTSAASGVPTAGAEPLRIGARVDGNALKAQPKSLGSWSRGEPRSPSDVLASCQEVVQRAGKAWRRAARSTADLTLKATMHRLATDLGGPDMGPKALVLFMQAVMARQPVDGNFAKACFEALRLVVGDRFDTAEVRTAALQALAADPKRPAEARRELWAALSPMMANTELERLLAQGMGETQARRTAAIVLDRAVDPFNDHTASLGPAARLLGGMPPGPARNEILKHFLTEAARLRDHPRVFIPVASYRSLMRHLMEGLFEANAASPAQRRQDHKLLTGLMGPGGIDGAARRELEAAMMRAEQKYPPSAVSPQLAPPLLPAPDRGPPELPPLIPVDLPVQDHGSRQEPPSPEDDAAPFDSPPPPAGDGVEALVRQVQDRAPDALAALGTEWGRQALRNGGAGFENLMRTVCAQNAQGKWSENQALSLFEGLGHAFIEVPSFAVSLDRLKELVENAHGSETDRAQVAWRAMLAAIAPPPPDDEFDPDPPVLLLASGPRADSQASDPAAPSVQLIGPDLAGPAPLSFALRPDLVRDLVDAFVRIVQEEASEPAPDDAAMPWLQAAESWPVLFRHAIAQADADARAKFAQQVGLDPTSGAVDLHRLCQWLAARPSLLPPLAALDQLQDYEQWLVDQGQGDSPVHLDTDRLRNRLLELTALRLHEFSDDPQLARVLDGALARLEFRQDDLQAATQQGRQALAGDEEAIAGFDRIASIFASALRARAVPERASATQPAHAPAGQGFSTLLAQALQHAGPLDDAGKRAYTQAFFQQLPPRALERAQLQAAVDTLSAFASTSLGFEWRPWLNGLLDKADAQAGKSLRTEHLLPALRAALRTATYGSAGASPASTGFKERARDCAVELSKQSSLEMQQDQLSSYLNWNPSADNHAKQIAERVLAAASAWAELHPDAASTQAWFPALVAHVQAMPRELADAAIVILLRRLDHSKSPWRENLASALGAAVRQNLELTRGFTQDTFQAKVPNRSVVGVAFLGAMLPPKGAELPVSDAFQSEPPDELDL